MNQRNFSMLITIIGLGIIGTSFLRRKKIPVIIINEQPVKEETVIQIDVKYIETAIEALKMAEEKSKSPEVKAIYRDSIENLDIVAQAFRET